VTTLLPEQPLPNVTVGDAPENLSEAGRLSVNAIPLCAGNVPAFTRVKTRSVAAESLMVAGDHALVSVGLICATTRHWSLL
jgi:hypothetical protein